MTSRIETGIDDGHEHDDHAPVEGAAIAKKVAMLRPEADAFVERNQFEIPEGQIESRCVDGRYEAAAARKAPLSVPGADAGYVLVAFAALRELGIHDASEQDVWSAVVRAAGGPSNFRFHTDTHANHDHKGAGRGCGHLALAANQEKGGFEKYGVSDREMEFLFRQLDELADWHPRNQVVLDGDHLERAVLVVESETHGVVPMEHAGSPGGRPNQVFVFQKTLHENRMGELCSILMSIPAVSRATTPERLAAAMDEVFNKQLSATLGELAPGDPVHQISIVRGKVAGVSDFVGTYEDADDTDEAFL
ncbi:hypothetical protein A2344_01300 [Candidatus Peregrinibacteria bacterium RIFOXYB12_FULL_41_12]|nr:MAG: hypothetical protein A2344_01300 [Candidatus Peregrinibacteria bacterium RIFOXYB12_FULL_41_12]OGJ48331.1 MAG: hypothetical protein A2244_02355 [Candidatus Peregrinibacteria bacterium RIFOXYA2_FULL_41_18]OGJ53587.1 MAG: hypothetical protein A2448_03915 [Candidatus Peregrinibacteria bacterium RIFOXYC2_FULL_41_22]